MMNTDKSKSNHITHTIEKLFTEYWHDSYVTKLAVIDHCRELIQLWDKDKVTNMEMEKFQMKLTDMFIISCFELMTLYKGNVDIDFDLILSRLEEFQTKLQQYKSLDTLGKENNS